MFVIIAVLIGLIIGFARGGSVSSIFNHLYKKWYLGFAGVILLILLHYAFLVQPLVTPIEQYLPILNFIAYILVLLMLIFNLDDLFTIFLSVGVTLNFIVTFINSGYLPVSDAVLSQIPINYTLVQSIYTGMNGIYSLMQPQTLLSFLGIIIPFPILSGVIALFGTIPGFSIGDILILIGIAGAIQSSMVLSKKEPQIVTLKEESKPRVRKQKTPVTAQKRPEHFESRTEELFFEDTILPGDPLDKIFGEEPQRSTKIIEDLSDIKAVNTGNYQFKEESNNLSVDDLTKPLGTGIINSKEVNSRLKQQEEVESVEIIKEEEGFFASSYLNGKEKSAEISTEEIFKDTNNMNDVRFVTNDIDIQTAEIVVDEGEKPIYKPTQEKIERERQVTVREAPVNEQEQQKELVTIEPEFELEPETPPVKVEEPVRKGLIDKTPIPKASEAKPVVQRESSEVSVVTEPIIGESPIPFLEIDQEVQKSKITIPEPVVKGINEQIVMAPKSELSESEKPVILTPKQIPETTIEKEELKSEPKLPKTSIVETSEVVQQEQSKEEVKPRKKFGIEPGNFLYLSSQLEPTKSFVPDESLIKEEVPPESTQEFTDINDIFFDYDQYQLLLSSIKDEGFRKELEKTFRDYSKNKFGAKTELKPGISEEPVQIETAEINDLESETKPVETEIESISKVPETKAEEAVEEVVINKASKFNEVNYGGPTSSIKEHDKILQEEKLNKETETTDEEEITDIIKADINEAPKLRDLLIENEPDVESTSEEEVSEEVIAETQDNEELWEINSEEISPQETETEEVIQSQVETTEFVDEDIQEVEDISEETADFLPVIDWNSFANLILEDKELKRGSYVQGNDSGYFVNKAYKEERSKMDKSEERMMNVWSNLSKENQKRKLERRKQATGTYFNQNEQRKPVEPDVVETEIEEVEANTEPLETASMSETERVNQMSDEEREKAGYEKVTINFQGNEISFWQKKVRE